MSDSLAESTHYRACTLCEAICGLEIKVSENQIVSIKGDKQDPLSKGHICPKAVALKDIQEDPDRLKQPHKKIKGKWVKISWDQALQDVVDRLWNIQQKHGDNAIGTYLGNPNVHNYGSLTHGPDFLKLLKSKNRFSATSVDQLPHQLISTLMYGHQLLLPVPDIDHTDYFLILGANPLVSNGSMMTAPNMKGRLKTLQARSGKFVVLDPRRTETAKAADHHYFIRPGSDVVFLLAFIKIMIEDHLITPAHLSDHLNGLNEVIEVIETYPIEDVSQETGMAVEDIRSIVQDFTQAEKASIYGRMGVSTTEFGSLCHWLIQLINILSGNLDKVGGTLMTDPAVDLVEFNLVGAGGHGRWQSRVSKVNECCGEFSSSLMAEEILTEGNGQIKAMFVAAGNPVLSTPNGRQLDKALESLDFMVAMDFYINETTRHADIILPPTAPLEHDHYDVSFLGLAVRNVTRFSEAVIDADEDTLHDWQIYEQLKQRFRQKDGKNISQKSRAPARLINFGLSFGPYGRKRKHPAGLSLKKLQDNPHGIDLGALKAGMMRKLRTKDRKIMLMPEILVTDLQRLRQKLSNKKKNATFQLIGKRDIRSNNSWMHNSQRLVKGPERCMLLMNPEDAKSLCLSDQQQVMMTSRTGSIKLALWITDDVMQATVCMPHGWGHDREGTRTKIATAHAGVSMNDLTDETYRDQLAGTAAVNAVPVTVTAA